MFRQMRLDLGDNYSICAAQESYDIAIVIYNHQKIVGKGRLITDNIDVSCITSISVDDHDINYKFIGKYTLGDVVIKFLLKFPTIVRKAEFRFILEVPENLKSTIMKYHFDRGEGSNIEKEILIRRTTILSTCSVPTGIVFKRSIEKNDLINLLSLLKENAYWQSHLTIDRLKLLIKNAQCFFATTELGKIVGFARVVTDNNAFASLWDVVVDKQYQKQGIGIALMNTIFSDEMLSQIVHWVVFTDTAKKLYEKFGFVSENEIPSRKLVHKLRLQDSHPTYMSELIQTAISGLSVHLNEEQSLQFLFGETGKRKNLASFWKGIPRIDEKQRYQHDATLNSSQTPVLHLFEDKLSYSKISKQDDTKVYGSDTVKKKHVIDQVGFHKSYEKDLKKSPFQLDPTKTEPEKVYIHLPKPHQITPQHKRLLVKYGLLTYKEDAIKLQLDGKPLAMASKNL